MNCLEVSVLICCLFAELISEAASAKKPKTYSALNSILFTNIPEPEDDVHNEYFFGKCLTVNKELIVHDHLDYKDIKGQMIVRGYLDLNFKDNLPNCVYIKASAPHGDMVRYNAHKFTVCIINITHNSKGMVHTFYYYEWFIPVQMQEGKQMRCGGDVGKSFLNRICYIVHKLTMNSLSVSVLLSVLVVKVSSYKTISSLNSIVFTNIPHTPGDDVHSEYYFGKCAIGKNRNLLAHDHFEYEQIKNIAIVRGLFKIFKLSPNCVYIKASSPYGDMVRYNAYKFNFCFIKIIYYHNERSVFRSQYYEWFIPVEMQPDINWDLYFYSVT